MDAARLGSEGLPMIEGGVLCCLVSMSLMTTVNVLIEPEVTEPLSGCLRSERCVTSNGTSDVGS